MQQLFQKVNGIVQFFTLNMVNKEKPIYVVLCLGFFFCVLCVLLFVFVCFVIEAIVGHNYTSPHEVIVSQILFLL